MGFDKTERALSSYLGTMNKNFAFVSVCVCNRGSDNPLPGELLLLYY